MNILKWKHAFVAVTYNIGIWFSASTRV